MNTSISSKKKKKLFGKLREANSAFQKAYPGDRPERQAVHTVYGGANLFKSDSAHMLGIKALESFELYSPGLQDFRKIFRMEGDRTV